MPNTTVPCNFNYNPQSVGMGIRYKTPVGPVRVDLGYMINPTRYPIQEEDKTESLRRINFFSVLDKLFNETFFNFRNCDAMPVAGGDAAGCRRSD